MYFVIVQSHTTPQYNQSGNKFRLSQSHHQAFSLQELSIKTLTAARLEISSFDKNRPKILEQIQ
jgi:hypothetical protein